MNDYTPIIREPSTDGIPSSLGSIPATTSATITQYYSELKREWEVGSQLALLDGTPYTRRFSFPSFPSNSTDRLDYIPLNGYDETYKGDGYFQVTSTFIETEYYSTSTSTHKNFTRWERNISHLNQHIIYSKEVLSTVIWNRPSNSASYQEGAISPTIPSGPPGSPSSAPPGSTNGTSCANLFPTTEATPTSTGTGPGFNPTPTSSNGTVLTGPSPSTGDTTTPSITCKQWQALPIPFILTFSAGSSIAVSLTADAPFTLRVKDSPNSPSGKEVPNGMILMSRPYLEIIFSNPTISSPTKVTVTTYGKELWRSFSPAFIGSDTEILVHPDNTALSNRLRPPNVSVNDNFWNNSPNLDPYQNFVSRQFQGAGAFI